MRFHTVGRAASPRRHGFGATITLLAVGLGVTGCAGGTTGAAPTKVPATSPTQALVGSAPADLAAVKPAVKPAVRPKPAKKSVPTTLAALNTWMGAAIRAAGSATFVHTTTVGKETTNTRTGDVRWAGGTVSYRYGELSGSYRGEVVVGPEGSFLRQGTVDAPGTWWRMSASRTDLWSRSTYADIQQMRQYADPTLLYPRYGRTAVTRGSTPVVVDGQPCTVFQLKLTAAQAYASQPAELRPAPQYQGTGTTTTLYYVDSQGLPRQVVQIFGSKSGSYREAITFRDWGRPVTINPPDGDVTEPPMIGTTH